MLKNLMTLIPCLALAACAGGTDDDNGGEIGNILDKIRRSSADSCEVFVTSEGLTCRGIEGAESFLAADLTLRDDDTFTGRFYIVLYANEAWQAYRDWVNGPGADATSCVVAAAISGEVKPDGGPCGACDLSISYNMNGPDNSLTTCPQGYVNNLSLQADDAFWGFIRNSDGSASGWDTEREIFRNGVHAGDRVQVWSNGACEWYGTGECT